MKFLFVLTRSLLLCFQSYVLYNLGKSIILCTIEIILIIIFNYSIGYPIILDKLVAPATMLFLTQIAFIYFNIIIYSYIKRSIRQYRLL